MHRGRLRVLAPLPLIGALLAGCDAGNASSSVERPVVATTDGGTAGEAESAPGGCLPAFRVPVIGEDPFCPSFHAWLGAQPEPRVGLVEQCTQWQVCAVAYVGGGACFHCADASSTPHADD